MKIVLQRLGILMLSVTLTACITEKMWKPVRYTEKVDSFLITEDHKQLVILGSKYHYIFPIDSRLRKILTLKNRKDLSAHFYSFHVSTDGKISGEYRLRRYLKNGALGEINELKAAGFKKGKTNRDGEDVYYFHDKIVGTRYLADASLKTQYQFNENYLIFIEEENPAKKVAANTLLTPVTVAADGALSIAGFSLIVVIFTVGEIFGDFQVD